jgi:hypothetical protein
VEAKEAQRTGSQPSRAFGEGLGADVLDVASTSTSGMPPSPSRTTPIDRSRRRRTSPSELISRWRTRSTVRAISAKSASKRGAAGLRRASRASRGKVSPGLWIGRSIPDAQDFD